MKPTPKGSLFNSLSSDRLNVKVKDIKRSKTYNGYNTLSFRPIHTKPMPKCSLFNSLSSDRSRSKSRKGQKHNLVITQSVFVRFICYQHQNVHFSILSSDRSKVKVKARKRLKTYFGHNMLSFRPIHIEPTPEGSLFNSLSSDRSKVKVKVTKSSKTYFGHNTLSFRPIHMKPTQKCSLFNSLSFDWPKVKVKVRKRSKTYFGHNTLSFLSIHMKPTSKCSFSIPYTLIGQWSRSGKGQKHILVIIRSVFIRFI